MGNDGGSIPTRRELVKEAARNRTTTEVKESQNEQQEYLWTTDPISQKPLSQPVVSDCNGKLYNKDTILELLAEGARKEEADRVSLGSIKSLKDVVEVKFETEKRADEKPRTGTTEVWICPVTGDKLGPGSKAVYIVPCGHAFSGSAIKEASSGTCLLCETAHASNDVISIIPTAEEDIARLSLRMKNLQDKGLAHSLKKKASGSKKRKKVDDTADESVGTNKLTSEKVSRTATPVNGSERSATINNASTASLTAKVLQEQEKAKKRKLENENVKSLFSDNSQDKRFSKNRDFMTRGFSVPAGSNR